MREPLRPSNLGTWEEVRDRLNRSLRGWTSCFSYGTRLPTCRALDHYVCEQVRGYLRKRHKVQSRGRRWFSGKVVFGARGVMRLRRVQLGVAVCASMR